MPKDKWTKDDIRFLEENWNIKTTVEIAEFLHKTEMAVHLYAYRKRMIRKSKVKRNILLEILRIRFIRPELFMPDKEFFKEIGMSNIRFWRIYRGEEPIKEEEYKRIVGCLGITIEQAFEARQLTLFDENNNNG